MVQVRGQGLEVNGVALAEGRGAAGEGRRSVRNGREVLAVQQAASGQHGHHHVAGLMQQGDLEAVGLRIQQDVRLLGVFFDLFAILHLEADSRVIAARHQRHVVIWRAAARMRDFVPGAIQP